MKQNGKRRIEIGEEKEEEGDAYCKIKLILTLSQRIMYQKYMFIKSQFILFERVPIVVFGDGLKNKENASMKRLEQVEWFSIRCTKDQSSIQRGL